MPDLFAGTVAAWNTEGDSMAKRIEAALMAVPLQDPGDPTGRRRLLVAIAGGVIAYLHDNPDAIRVRDSHNQLCAVSIRVR
jgi:hypothetical protein